MDIFLRIFNETEYKNSYKKGLYVTKNKEHNIGFGIVTIDSCNDLFLKMKLAQCSGFLDQGCGTGQVVLYAFLMFINLKNVYGIELLKVRYDICKEYITKLCIFFPDIYKLVKNTDCEFIIEDITPEGPQTNRRLIISNCSLYCHYDYNKIDSILSNVCIYKHNIEKYKNIFKLFKLKSLFTFEFIGTPDEIINIKLIREPRHKLYLYLNFENTHIITNN